MNGTGFSKRTKRRSSRFTPHNEDYIDRDIRDTTGGAVPFNENLLDAKNYASIEDFLPG